MENKIYSEKERFIHRDLSWLSFNGRVLEEAADIDNPLLERVKFLAIYINNLDEFLMVRYAGLKKLEDSQYNKEDKYGYYPGELKTAIKERLDQQFKKLYALYKGDITAELNKRRIFIRQYRELSEAQQRFCKKHFEKTVFPITTPMAVDQGHPFPILSSKTLAFAVSLEKAGEEYLSIIPIPKNIPRLIKMPSAKDETCFILLEELMRSHIETFFRGYKITSSLFFKVIRDSELEVQEEYTDDLLKAIEGEVKKRVLAKAVYLESEKPFNKKLLATLCEKIGISEEETRAVDGNPDLKFLFELIPSLSKPDLLYKGFVAAKAEYESIFDKIKEGDFLVALPFESFQPTVDLLKEAAKDPGVLAIKMTLYRVDEDSAIIEALKAAARKKKQVTVLVEIKARFDEEKNIEWAKQLEVEGCHVIYGIPKIKIHSKITLVVRKEEGRIVRYVHLSTGNYNEKTSRIYTDLGFFTCNEDFARDISDVFNVITGYSVPGRWRKIVSAPNDLRQYFKELIDKEIECQKKYGNGALFAKMNSLEDVKIIDKLYEASRAGVSIKLIVRGICCLVPGIPGLSENIQVHSIVGRFLEHSRVFRLNNNGTPRFFMSSADWMSRNFDRRIELLFEVDKQELKEELGMLLDCQWRDTEKTRMLYLDKEYARPEPGEVSFNSQEYLIKYFSKGQRG